MRNITTVGAPNRESTPRISLDFGRHSPAVGSIEDPGKRAQAVSVNGAPRLAGITMHMNLSLTPLVSLIAGILILVMPKLLNYIIAIYLIIIGLLGLFGTGASFHLH
jgi:hypothetical protein